MKNLLVAHFPLNLPIPENTIAITSAKRDKAFTWNEIIHSAQETQPSAEDFLIFYKHKDNLIRIAARWSVTGECYESLAGACINLISTYNQWIKNKPINASLFFTAMPHRLNDFCLQIVLAEKGIPTFFSRKNFEYDSWVLRDFTSDTYCLSDHENIDFHSNKVKYHNFISLSVPKHEAIIRNHLEAKFIFFAACKIIFNFTKRFLFRGTQDVLGPDSQYINLIRWDLMHLRSLISIKRRRFYYKSLSVPANKILDNSVVFFLPFQPEGNTDPEAGEYADVFKSIAEIKHSFPSKKLYIKEHPASFSYMHYKEVSGSFKFRTKLFYKKLHQSNIDLVDISSMLNEFPANTTVATVNGSVFLQARHFGFNGFKTGRSWYDFDMECSSIESAADQEKLNHKILHLLQFSFGSEKEILDLISKKFSL
jgi:hypothetical protein